jgi:hypothetical protein
MNVTEVAEVDDEVVVDEVQNLIHKKRMKIHQKLLKMIVRCHPERM